MALNKDIPDSYIEQPGCYTCRNVFIIKEWDLAEKYYCFLNAIHPRVRCGSPTMGEAVTFLFFKTSIDNVINLYDATNNYYKPKEVKPCGLCLYYERNKK